MPQLLKVGVKPDGHRQTNTELSKHSHMGTLKKKRKRKKKAKLISKARTVQKLGDGGTKEVRRRGEGERLRDEKKAREGGGRIHAWHRTKTPLFLSLRIKKMGEFLGKCTIASESLRQGI